jgi:hypothetical protein
VRKNSAPPKIADLMAMQQNEVPNNAAKKDGQIANELASNVTRQLNARVPIDLYTELLRMQAELTAQLGEKPPLQELLAACLRIGLGDGAELAKTLTDEL